MDLIKRPRRLRSDHIMRKMVRETRVDASSLIYPIFIEEGTNIQEEIKSMEGQYRYSIDRLPYKLEELSKSGVDKLLLFGIPKDKDAVGTQAYDDKGIIQEAIRSIKRRFPDLYLISDVCMCEYTSHGHCGILSGEKVVNDPSAELMAKIALNHVQAGADVVAPSDMMDGRVGAIRRLLDHEGYKDTAIMSYAVKYASSFYGPFREAADSAPAFGDRKTYQMDYHNTREGIKEALLDVEEGADMLIVKPALAYHDMISKVKNAVTVPVATYSVSGEYAMVKAASKAGWINEADIVCEMAMGAYRAGADIYISYFAEALATYMKEGRIG